jgi:hypothetical protein
MQLVVENWSGMCLPGFDLKKGAQAPLETW